MENNFIPIMQWKHPELTKLDVLYGFSHKSQGYFPYKEITEVKSIGELKTGGWKFKGVKGFAENGDKLYITLTRETFGECVKKGWLKDENI